MARRSADAAQRLCWRSNFASTGATASAEALAPPPPSRPWCAVAAPRAPLRPLSRPGVGPCRASFWPPGQTGMHRGELRSQWARLISFVEGRIPQVCRLPEALAISCGLVAPPAGAAAVSWTRPPPLPKKRRTRSSCWSHTPGHQAIIGTQRLRPIVMPSGPPPYQAQAVTDHPLLSHSIRVACAACGYGKEPASSSALRGTAHVSPDRQRRSRWEHRMIVTRSTSGL